MHRPLVFLVPGRLETRTGGYEYDRRMIGGLRHRGWPVDVRELDDSFPRPTPQALEQADHVLAGIADGTIVLIDGLAGGAMAGEIERHASRLSIVPVVHSLLAAEIGIDRATARQFEASERRALVAAALVVAVGKGLLAPLARLGVEAHRVAVVPPGIDRAP